MQDKWVLRINEGLDVVARSAFVVSLCRDLTTTESRVWIWRL